ncbi:MAG: type II toxin-antitoxin system RelE/ParE family toxin [Candidatus Acidiferrales bacterium]
MPDKRLEVRWLKRALANLEAEAEYISRDNRAAAQRVVMAVERSVELLARHPALGRHGRVEGTRELVIAGTPYIIPYRVREGRVEILRVFHAARKWPPKL